jgi:hypothetical protein
MVVAACASWNRDISGYMNFSDFADENDEDDIHAVVARLIKSQSIAGFSSFFPLDKFFPLFWSRCGEVQRTQQHLPTPRDALPRWYFLQNLSVEFPFTNQLLFCFDLTGVSEGQLPNIVKKEIPLIREMLATVTTPKP